MFMYHGAEHRVLHCYEHGVEPTLENSKRYPVCISLRHQLPVFGDGGQHSAFAVVGAQQPVDGHAAAHRALPLVAGLAYELLRFAARHENNWCASCARRGCGCSG